MSLSSVRENNSPAPDRQSCEALFLAEMGNIENIIAFVARRYRLNPRDAEEFDAEVKLQLVSGDYRLLRRFEGRSKLETYLFTVIHSLFWEWRNKNRGRWRSSAAARRGGETAIKLEELIYRDGYRFEEAVRILQTNHRIQVSETELEALFVRLPERPRRQFVDVAPLETMPIAGPGAEEQILDEARNAIGRKIGETLRRAVSQLPCEDQLILRLHFQRDLKLVEVARSLGRSQKKLYRQVEKLLKHMRRELKRNGLSEYDSASLQKALSVSAEIGAGISVWGPPNKTGEAKESS